MSSLLSAFLFGSALVEFASLQSTNGFTSQTRDNEGRGGLVRTVVPQDLTRKSCKVDVQHLIRLELGNFPSYTKKVPTHNTVSQMPNRTSGSSTRRY